MNVCAVTMVYRDYWALSQWYKHYCHMLGGHALYIVAHGPDPKIQQICPEANVIVIPRDVSEDFDRKRSIFLNKFQSALLEVNDWVIRVDADELIVIDPGVHSNIFSFLNEQKDPVLFALGLEVGELVDDAEIPVEASVFDHRKSATFSGHYSKACIICKSTHLIRHGVQVKKSAIDAFQFNLPKGLYLAHLKYANKRALLHANLHRRAIANGPGQGLPGKAWREADKEAVQFYRRFELLPEFPWEKVRDDAFRMLSGSEKRNPNDGVIKVRQLKFSVRTLLPDWFGS